MSEKDWDISRRKVVLSLLPGGLATVGLAAGSIATLAPTQPRSLGRVRRICRLADMEVGGQQTIDGESLFVVRGHDGIRAISLECTHLGCGLTRYDQGFRCACHGSVFDDLGRPLQGPASRDLTWFKVEVNEGWILVDLDQPVATGTSTSV